MNLHDWIDELCDALDIELDEVDESLVHDVAAEAAENVGDQAGVISAFLLGYASAQSEADPEDLERLAGRAIDLAQRWDRSPTALDEDDVEIEDDQSAAADEDLAAADDFADA